MKDGGILAIVLPSGGVNRQKSLKNAEISGGFLLPNGAFTGTQIGTDIIILKKKSLKQTQDISNYFKENPETKFAESPANGYWKKFNDYKNFC